MTTDPGDLVLDPTCGSGTTAYVAEQWGRRWITIDTSRVALALARARLMGATLPLLPARRLARGPAQGGRAHRHAAAAGADRRRHPARLRLRARAAHHAEVDRQQPRHREGMSREEIDAAIARHAETETALRPALRGQARWSGSPGRSRSRACRRTASLAFAGSADDAAGEPSSDGRATPTAPTFEQTILDNLRTAGVQNGAQGRAARRSTASSPTPATLHPGVGEREDGADGAPKRVGDRDRPAVRHGRPGVHQGRRARGDQGRRPRPALRLGFAFDPQALGATATSTSPPTRASPTSPPSASSAGSRAARADEPRPRDGRGAQEDRRRQPVHGLRRARHRRSRAERRRASSSSSAASTSTTRPPARSAATTPTRSRCGSSTPTTTARASSSATATSPAANDPYKRLKTRAEGRDRRGRLGDASTAPSRARSPSPTTGKIAVKVINHYGDEVMKVFEVGGRLTPANLHRTVRRPRRGSGARGRAAAGHTNVRGFTRCPAVRRALVTGH